jgi:hypothetical protein
MGKTQVIGVRLKDATIEKVKKKAKQNRRTLSGQIRVIIEDDVEPQSKG